MKTTELAIRLKEKFLGETFILCTRRNGTPANGWSIVGNAQFTKAIKMAGLPYNNFWSGSLPTPSTQAPSEIVNFLTSITKK